LTRVIVATALLFLAGCGGHRAAAAEEPRSPAEVERAFADHGIPLVLVQPEAGARLRYEVLFGQSGSLSVSVRVYSRVRPARSARGVLGVRNVVATWQGADRPSIEAAMDELR
jgi:hypothetical protein